MDYCESKFVELVQYLNFPCHEGERIDCQALREVILSIVCVLCHLPHSTCLTVQKCVMLKYDMPLQFMIRKDVTSACVFKVWKI